MKKLFALYLLVTFAVFAAACGGGVATNNTTSSAKPATKTDAPKADAPKTDAPKPADAKTDVAATGDSVGVAECDDYIKKYEACLTSIAAKAPQVEGPMKVAFQKQRDGFKQAAETPAGKATLKDVCTKAIETAKATTTAYACSW